MSSRQAHRDITRMLAAETVSSFGSMFSRLALPGVAARLAERCGAS